MTTNRNKNLRDDERWNENYNRLVAFKDKFGHTNVPRKYVDDDEEDDDLCPLGNWVNNQRTEYRVYQKRTKGKAGPLTPERIAKLNAIDFQWNPGKQAEYDNAWNTMFQELVDFQQKYNTTKVPKLGCKDDKNDPPFRKLFGWIEGQLAAYNKLMRNQPTSLTPDRLRRLESIGMSWNTRRAVTKDEKWLKPYYFNLVALQHKYNMIDVSEHYHEYRGLAKWVKRQKHDYDKYLQYGEGRMTAWRFGLLQSINFARMSTTCKEEIASSPNSNNERWAMMYIKLQAYKEQYGSTLVPTEWQEDPSLALWVSTQRVKYGQLASISTMAEELDGQGKVGDTTAGEQRLRASVALAFNYSYPGQSHQGVTAEDIVQRISLLNEIDFVWDPLEEQWKEKYQRLIAFQTRENNSTLVFHDYDQDPELGQWVEKQRVLYGEFARMGDDVEALKESIRRAFDTSTYAAEGENGRTVETMASRISRLNSIGFVWDPPLVGDDQWMEKYQKLRAYVKEFDSVLVPYDYSAAPGLGNWVSQQRRSYKWKTLSKEQIFLLESIGFVWDASV
eukprot:CAMPEP_0194034284 /NCGR_PEP_ID=MMETSP0009_2-20130614/6692_1 /TAXON_ID=210454 /ORGANISM="Grammatophora oceanica, Strain CCMP 410" /LENGTH=558 /DNA_ID=CAMNT_0038675133 /DNA_START=54 /DNA_END=1730 /DNA_ORIENTATION=+